MSTSLIPIIDERRFILATRDTGYKSTATAIAELVDNAIQARASIVRIFVSQDGIGSDRQLSVAVLDNGCGMDRKTLQQAMQFAGSSRFNDRLGLGRFGMGLPNSSVSQARRVDVYTWQSGGKPLHTYLDIDDICSGSQVGVPRPKSASLPTWAATRVRKNSGTLVVWSRCDRLDNRKAATVVVKLTQPLGQRFRYFLWAGNKIYVNDELVQPFDPLYLQPPLEIAPARTYGGTLEFQFRPLGNRQAVSTVRVRFVELPVAEWQCLSADERRELGIPKGAGVSVVRGGREVDFGWFFMGGKRKENYDDWWRCEVAFEPELDELFGVTHSKQEINPTEMLRLELGQQLEAIGHALNARVRSSFAMLKKQATCYSTAEVRANNRETALPPARFTKTPRELWRTSASRSQVTPASGITGAKIRFHIKTVGLDHPEAYVWDESNGNSVTIQVNRNHAFYDQVYSRLDLHGVELKAGIDSMLIAMVRAELGIEGGDARKVVESYRRLFSNILAAYLGD